MKSVYAAAAFAAACFCGPFALAQTTEPVASATQAPAAIAAETAPATIIIPAGTQIEVEVTEALGSDASHQQQTFGLRLAAPIVVGGQTLVEAGAPGGGEVIDAAPSAFGGRQGRLIISGRYIEISGARARIRGMQLGVAGESRTNTALGVSMIPVVGIASFLVQGGEIEIPAGARGVARLAEDVVLPAPPRTQDSAALPAAGSSSLGGESQQ